MPYNQRTRTSAFGSKNDGVSRTSKLLADDEECNSRCGSSYERSGSRSSSLHFNNINSSNATASASMKQENYVSSSSSSASSSRPHALTAVQNVVLGSSDESGSDFDIEASRRRMLNSNKVLEPGDWGNSSASSLVDELVNENDDSLGGKVGASIRHRVQGVRPLNWRDRYTSQPARLHDSMSKNFVIDHGRPQRLAPACPSQRCYRKGSSSKAPQTDDLTAPLLLDKKARPTPVQGESEGHTPGSLAALGSKNRNASTVRRVTHSASIASEISNRRKGSSQTYYGHRVKPEEVGAGNRDIGSNGAGPSRRGLSNLVCSSVADVLPSVSTSTLSNFACTSVADVLPSVPSSLGGATSYFRPRKNSRDRGLVEGEAGRSTHQVKRQVEDSGVFGMREAKDIQNGQAQDQVLDGSAPRLTRSSYNHQSRPEPLRTDFVTWETSTRSSATPSLLPNYRHLGRNVALSRSGDGLGSLYRSNRPFFESDPASGEELPNQWSVRRRSLYGSRADPVGPDSHSFSRNLSHTRPSSSSWSVLRETQYAQSSFSGPPARPPPLPPLAVLAEPSASGSSFPFSPPSISPEFPYISRGFVLPSQGTERASAAEPGETSSFNPSTSSGESRPRLTVEGLSEILSALEYIERDEDLSYEQILMLEATILLGGIGLHDRYRDMRVDIDNMSYEELLALEERIGNVNVGLSEESVKKSVRVEIFTSPVITCGYVPQEIEIKCSICQEEFEEAVELGVLGCGHSHHITCIKQWLLQKNQCPICKAPAVS